MNSVNQKKIDWIIEDNLKNPCQWIDPYDSEKIKNRYVRGLAKRIALFKPTLFYRLGFFEKNIWDENYIMLGTAALNLKRKDLVRISLEKMGVPERLHWGLPINWHSGKYIFPKNMLMSTTTSEGILFLCEVYKNYPELIEKKYINQVAKNLMVSLKRNKIEDTSKYLFSYTPVDEYQVFNANLLVAAALGVSGNITQDEELKKIAEEIYLVCEQYIPKEGFIPYSIFGKEDTADSYHQLFSMRAVYHLKQHNIVNGDLLERIEKYFLTHFYIKGKVYLKPNSKIIDLQPYAEALRYFAISENKNEFVNLYSYRFNLMKKDKFVQRVWRQGSITEVKSNVCYSRQGYLRLLLALSYVVEDEL